MNLHLFCILVLCDTYSDVLPCERLSVDAARHAFETGLTFMKKVQRSCLMTLRAHESLTQFLKVFNTISTYTYYFVYASQFPPLCFKSYPCKD